MQFSSFKINLKSGLGQLLAHTDLPDHGCFAIHDKFPLMKCLHSTGCLYLKYFVSGFLFSLRHFGHLFHNSIKNRHNSSH